MHKICACIDGQANTPAVLEAAIWAAQRLAAPLQCLHVLERRPVPPLATDYSGAIGLGAQEALLHELAELDARRGELAQEAGRQLLARARQRARDAALVDIETTLRHGDLAETATELRPATRLFVLGQHGTSARSPRHYLDHHVEAVVRGVDTPVMVVAGDRFTPPSRAVLAYDGSETAARTVQRVAGSPLLAGLPLVVAMAGAETAAARAAIDQAGRALSSAGFAVSLHLQPGDPEDVLPPLVGAADALLVMGAYGHSRIRQLMLGSTTTALLRTSEVPVLVLR